MNPQEQTNLYRQALGLLFGKEIAHRTQVRYYESNKGRKKVFWVNSAFRTDYGVKVSPTGWKSFTPKELEEETDRLFRQSRADDTQRGEICSQ